MTLQQMNMVMGGRPTEFVDPTGWTLIQEWDTFIGDMTAIDSAFSGTPRGVGFAWNPDGTRLTICNSTTDNIKTFICSTPWDPDTASETASRSETNPIGIQWQAGGNRAFVNVVVGDEIQAVPGSNYVIGTGVDESEITKADVGFTGTSDGFHIFPASGADYFLWEGVTGTDVQIKDISLSPAGDLDGFTVQDTQGINPPISSVNILGLGASVLSIDELNFYRAEGAAGVRLVSMTAPRDISSISYGSLTNLDPGIISFAPLKVWINPLDTSEVWVQGDENSPNMQLARLSTGL